MKYKVIDSAARNFADSFASALNWAADDYVMSHLLRAAVANNTSEYRIDLPDGAMIPNRAIAPEVLESIQRRAMRFPDHLRSQNVEPNRVSNATMTVAFDLEAVSPLSGPAEFEAPFRVMVRLQDDRGVWHERGVARRWCSDDWSRSASEPFEVSPIRRGWQWIMQLPRRHCG